MSRRALRSLRRRALEAARPAPIAYEKALASARRRLVAKIADVKGEELTREQAAALADVDQQRADLDVFRRWQLADGGPDPTHPKIAARRRAEVRDRILELRAERAGRRDPAPPPEESTPTTATSEEDAHGPP